MPARLAILAEVAIGAVVLMHGTEIGGAFGYFLAVCGAAWIASPGVIMPRRG